VTDQPLLKCRNSLILPDIGNTTVETCGTTLRIATEGIVNVLSRTGPRHCANSAIFKTK
jgi:phosphoglycerate dehydrogenase-like enzyme